MISPTLNVPQARFLSMPHKFKAYIAGFGSGKTWVGCGGICKGIWEHPGINQGYFAPTYPQIRDIFYPTVEEVAADWGLNVKINEGNKEVHFYYGRQYRGTTICRSMEKPQTIVGFKIGNALVDELDILPKEKARTAWRKIIARMRYKIDGLRNGIDVTTTPEGFKFVYEQFVKAVREKTELASLYGLVQASTFDNEKNLPADYIPSLLESYPPELIKAYLHASTNVSGSDDLNGINVKYRYEFTDTLGMVTSFSYAGDKNRQLTRYSDTRWHEDSVRNRWFSVMAGPSVRVNEWFSAYAMAGVAYSRVSTFSGDYLRVTDNKGKTHDVLTGSDDGRHSNTSLAWGAGVQFNPTESVAIDIAYEGSGSGDWRTDGFIVGVGYKF